MSNIILDLNCPVFQKDLFTLGKQDAFAVLKTLRTISHISWDNLYKSKGLNWELIYSKTGKKGEKIYSFQISKKIRATALKEGNYLRVLSLHPDHDSAYS